MMTERDIDVLGDLEAACRNHVEVGFLDGWARPLDCGATDGSDHSYRLAKLVRRGMAEAKQRSALRGRRGSKLYVLCKPLVAGETAVGPMDGLAALHG